jgi:hypothetical protein
MMHAITFSTNQIQWLETVLNRIPIFELLLLPVYFIVRTQRFDSNHNVPYEISYNIPSKKKFVVSVGCAENLPFEQI